MDLSQLTDKAVFTHDSKVPVAYILTHVQSGNMYIGSTANAYSRTATHRTHLKYGTHHIKALQSDYDDSPIIRFNYWITSSLEEARRIEQELVNYFWDTGRLYNRGRNIHKPNLGLERTEEFKQMISGVHKGKIVSEATRAKMAAVRKGRQVSDSFAERLRKQGEKNQRPVEIDGVVYPSTREAAKALGLPFQTVKGRLKRGARPTWRYLEIPKKDD